MNVAFTTTYNPSDIRAWSGLNTHILTALQNTGLRIEVIGNLKGNNASAFIKGAFYGRIMKKIYIKDFEPGVLKNYAAQLERALTLISYDLVFSPRTVPIAYLRTEKPIVFWHDATVAGLIDFYPGYLRVCAESIENGNKAEQLALTKCRLAIYSSEWAANTALQNYDVDPAKVKVIPFGANIECTRTLEDIRMQLKEKSFEICKLFFVGKEWERKGGEMALKIASLLNLRRIRTELHVVGCNPPGDLPGFVKRHGFISKSSEEGRRFLDDLYSQSHFFLLPTFADCTPVVFSEACSFGLPILTTNVGGIPTVIREGKNGFMFPLDDDPEAYCETIQRLWSSKTDYELLALSTFGEYAERLNWATAGKKVYDLIQETCG
jgi:glycosyltransferase involved in cell wall biosynthesis